jgi:transposase
MPEVWYLKEIRDRDRKIREQEKEIEGWKKKWEEEKRKRERAEQDLKHINQRKASKKPRFSDYSVSTQEKKMGQQERKKSPGRRKTIEKIGEAEIVNNIYPQGTLSRECRYLRSHTVTRLIDGKAVRVLYRIFETRDGSRQGQLSDVLPQGEYGIEIAVALALLVYGIEVSIDQACQILFAFCGLQISKSRADSLLQQLSVLWEKDFEALKELIALAMVVYMDETGWKINANNCYTWIFTTLLHTVLLYGESREEEVLDAILPRETFHGIGVSDCLKIYEARFEKAQKCWAHFLRTAIRLMLTCPDNGEYKKFFHALHAIFVAGKKAQQDTTLTTEQREQTAVYLQSRIRKLCGRCEEKIPKETDKELRDFINLQKRLVRNIGDLFTFVLVPQVEATNNRAERGFRKTSKARNNYQTSKTKRGAHRRSVIGSILASLRQNMPVYSLQCITDEAVRWRTEGLSLFQMQLQAMRLGESP